MSNWLAVATVTATLRQILDDAVRGDVNGASATAVRPNAPSSQLPSPGVNAYLYQVTPNPAWLNADVPTRNPNGELVRRPRAAIDLHYLLTFHGDEAALEPQRVLGSAVRILHDQPVLPRARIKEVVGANAFLAGSDLDEEIELVKFTPKPLDVDELSKLWSVFFQTSHLLSAAYVASVVLIEGSSAPRATLPVRERNVYVVTMRKPIVERVESGSGPSAPIVAGGPILIFGRTLRGEPTQVRIGDTLMTPTPDQVSDTLIRIVVPAATRAGVRSLQVEHPQPMGTPPVLHRGFASNAAPFLLHPTVTLAVSNVAAALDNGTPIVVDGVGLRSATVTATIAPAVGRRQRVELSLYEFDAPDGRSARAYVFDAPPDNGIADPAQDETTTIAFSVDRVFPAAYLARVQVDGAESPLEVDPDGLFNAPQVTI